MNHLSDRELATVLAALRYWHQNLAEADGQIPISEKHFGDGIEPLTVEDIDDLCERLNSEAVTTQP